MRYGSAVVGSVVTHLVYRRTGDPSLRLLAVGFALVGVGCCSPASPSNCSASVSE